MSHTVTHTPSKSNRSTPTESYTQMTVFSESKLKIQEFEERPTHWPIFFFGTSFAYLIKMCVGLA